MKYNFSTKIDNKYSKSKSERNEYLYDKNIRIINRPLIFEDVGIDALEKGCRQNTDITPIWDTWYQEFRRKFLNSESCGPNITDTLGPFKTTNSETQGNNLNKRVDLEHNQILKSW